MASFDVTTGEGSDIPSSIPYCNSNGRPVSLQMGNGMYCNSFFSLEMCSPVSLGGFC